MKLFVSGSVSIFTKVSNTASVIFAVLLITDIILHFILCGLVKCELRVASCELRVASYELRVAPVLRVASCELVVKSASWYV